MGVTTIGGGASTAEELEHRPPATAPEEGQLARVRGRMWVVAGVARDAQAARDGRTVQHLVSLISVEDDATGEELEVVWEIEPGTQGTSARGRSEPASAAARGHVASRWREQDSNLRRLSQCVYSAPRLTASVSRRAMAG